MAKSDVPGIKLALQQKPPLPPNSPLSDYVQQTLSLLLAYTYGETVALRGSPSGVLYTSSPRLTDVEHWTGSGANDVIKGNEIPCTEILVMAHPDNTGKVWVRLRQTPTVNNSFPLSAGDILNFSVESLSELQALIVADGEKLIVGYSL